MPAIYLGRSPERDRNIDDICQMIRNCARAGIFHVKYNFTIIGIPRSGTAKGRGPSRYSEFVYARAKQDPLLTLAGQRKLADPRLLKGADEERQIVATLQARKATREQILDALTAWHEESPDPLPARLHKEFPQGETADAMGAEVKQASENLGAGIESAAGDELVARLRAHVERLHRRILHHLQRPFERLLAVRIGLLLDQLRQCRRVRVLERLVRRDLHVRLDAHAFPVGLGDRVDGATVRDERREVR
jgi:hypothetical protein